MTKYLFDNTKLNGDIIRMIGSYNLPEIKTFNTFYIIEATMILHSLLEQNKCLDKELKNFVDLKNTRIINCNPSYSYSGKKYWRSRKI